MGFYTPATIVKNAQRHGINMKPVCVLQSDWHCTVVDGNTVRLGFCVVNGLGQEHAEELVRRRQDRPFKSLDDLKRHVPFTKSELRALAELGALNCFAKHRRAAMWKVEETLHDDLLGSAGILPAVSRVSRNTRRELFGGGAEKSGRDARSPLSPMTLSERVKADYETMNLTTGPHPMKLLREKLPNIWRAIDLVQARHGSTIRIAGNVVCRQRPGTAKGFVFISLEDETGVSNAIVDPDLFERFRLVITEEPFLIIEGEVQNTDNVVLVKARKLRPLPRAQIGGSESHDFR